MKKNSTINPLTYIVDLLSRFNLVIFIVIVAGGLIASIIILNNILTQPYTSKAVANPSETSFDQTVENRLLKLETSTNNVNYKNLPSGRINPFSE